LGLAPKPFQVLQYLIENAGTLVSQERLLDALWPDTYVQQEVLRKYILEIRRLLGDPAKSPRYIETHPKLGYRFIARVRDDDGAGSAALWNAGPGFVGRQEALAAIATGLRAARDGQRQVLFVTGEAGIGKTSLVDAFHAAAVAEPGVKFARGQCVEGFGGKESYYAVLEALGLLLRTADARELLDTLATHAPTWLIQFPAIVGPDRAASLRREIIGATRERMLREICESLEVFTAGQVLVLILEDLHLADESTLDLISAIARRRMQARMMLLGTYRPADAMLSGSPLKALKQDLLMHGLCREIALPPFTRQEVDAYLASAFRAGTIADELSGLVHQRSDGNPMFISALVDRLRERGWVAMEHGVWSLKGETDAGRFGAPDSLQQMLEVQLEQLSASEQRLVRAASVSGVRFPVWALAAMLELEEARAEGLCEDLAIRQQFLRAAEPDRLPDGREAAQYEFKHSLYREILYDRLPPAQRRELHLSHAMAAEAAGAGQDPLMAAATAAHFEAGREFGKAIRYLVLNAELAARRHAHADALEALRHASGLLSHLQDRERAVEEVEILERMSDALYAQGEMTLSADMDWRAVELAGDAGLVAARIQAWTRLARALAFQNPEQCVEMCRRAVDAAREYGDGLILARTEMLLACWRIVTDGWEAQDAELAASALRRMRSVSEELPASYEILYAHVQCLGGDYEDACRTAEAGIPKSESEGLAVYLSGHSSLVWALLHLGRWGELRRILASATHTAVRNGNSPWARIFQATTAWLTYQAGDLDASRKMAETLLAAYRPGPAGQVRTMATVTSGYCMLDAGDFAGAESWFRRVCERDKQPRFFLDWYWGIVARVGLALAYAGLGRGADAEREADTALRAALLTPDCGLQAQAWEAKTRAAICLGDQQCAGEFLAKAREVLHGGPVSHVSWRILAGEAEWLRARGRHGDAAIALRTAGEVLRQLAESVDPDDALRAVLLATARRRGIPL